jgi:hypothetical protein
MIEPSDCDLWNMGMSREEFEQDEPVVIVEEP